MMTAPQTSNAARVTLYINPLNKARERTDWLARFPEENPAPVMRVSLEGRVIYRNPAATQLPGWACEVDQPLSELLLALLRKAIAEARQIEQDAELMGRWYSVSVAPFPAEGYANIYGIDITIRKEAEVALREMQRQQRALLDNSPDMVWLKDKEGRFVAVNEAISKAYGHSSEELIGKTDFAFVPPELADSYQADDKYVMESRQRQRFVEPFVDAAGNSTVIETIKTPITNDRGEMIGTAVSPATSLNAFAPRRPGRYRVPPWKQQPTPSPSSTPTAPFCGSILRSPR